MEEFFSMGGYAGFIWPAYGLTVVVLVAVLVGTWRGLTARRRTLEQLQAARGGRRRRARAAASAEEADRKTESPVTVEQGRDA